MPDNNPTYDPRTGNYTVFDPNTSQYYLTGNPNALSGLGGDQGASDSVLDNFYATGGGPGTSESPSSSSTSLSSISSTSSAGAPSSGSPSASQIGMAAGSLPGLALGIYQTIDANKELKNLEKQPFPTYSISPELQSAYGEAMGMKDEGLTQGERANFQSDINRGAATNYANAIRLSGGSQSSAIMGAINSEQLGAYDKLAATDAEVHRQNLQAYYQLSGEMQRQRNLISQQQIEHRMALEEQYGKELQSGISNVTGAASSLAMMAPMLM